MRYYKVIDDDNAVIALAEYEEPEYVYRQINGMIITCDLRDAQGILSMDRMEIYRFEGYTQLGDDAVGTAIEIEYSEYEELKSEYDEDPEDDNPSGSDSISGDILTRAELTEKVTKLEEMNAMLTGMLLENREDSMKASKVYSEGDLIIVNGELYKVLAKIANGSLLTVGTNVKQTTIAAEIAALNV